MKAVLVENETKRLYIGEAKVPELLDHQLLVRVKATALNRADLLQRRGLYPPPQGESPILGLEMSGVIEEVGSKVNGGKVNAWKPGDRVMALLPGGGYAEYVSIPAEMAVRIPDTLTYEEAAAIPEAFLTAYLNLFVLGGLIPGQTALIHAGASGVGTAAIQLIREAGSASIVTTSNEHKRKACLQLGACAAIDYRTGSFAAGVMEATNGSGVNIILDCIGASYWEQNISLLAVDGRLIVIGLMGGSRVELLDLGLLLRRRLQIIGSTLRNKSLDDKIQLTEQFATFAMPRFTDGRLKPIVDCVWNWEQVNDAHEHMELNKNIGKIILRVQS